MILQRMGVRHLLRRPLLTLLCVLGVSLGVAVIIAIDLANASASRAFRLSTDAITGRATHQIVFASGTLDENLFAQLKAAGIRAAAPVIDAFATSVQQDQQPIRVIGVDVFSEAPFRNYLDPDSSAAHTADFAAFVARADSVVLSEDFATRFSLGVSDAISLQVGGRVVPLSIVGLLRSDDANTRHALDGTALVDIGTAQQLFAMPGRLSHIELIADERTEQGRSILSKVQSLLPPGAQIIKPEARSNSVESLSDAFELNLTALSLLALVVGVFLIYNTITFSVLQRRPIFGTLRCLGVTRREIFILVLMEALLVGVIGGAIGILAGVVLGRGAVRLVTQTINDLYYIVNVRDVAVPAWVLLKGFLLGVFAALLAALAPAWEATTIQPISVLKRSDIEQRVQRLLPWLAGLGCVFLAVGAWLLLGTAWLMVNLLGIFAVVMGAALISPLATFWLMRATHALAQLMGRRTLRMASRAVSYSLSRTGVAVASLMIAISVIIGLQGMIQSFRNTVNLWLSRTLVADVYIRNISADSNPVGSFLDPQTVLALQRVSGASSVNIYRRSIARFVMGSAPAVTEAARQAILIAEDTDAIRDVNIMKWTDLPGSWSQQWRALEGRDEILVSEPFANKFGANAQNNVLTLATDSGPRPFRIRGIFYDYGSDQGVVMMRRDLYRRYWVDEKVSSMALFLQGTPSAEQVDALRKRFAGQGLMIIANAELRENALRVFDRTFAITGALNFLAMLVAFIGVLSALMAMLIERTREFGVLRANGLTLPQLAQTLLVESGLIGAVAGLISLPVGLALALVLLHVINLRAFGWSIALDIGASTFIQALAISLCSALLAAFYPIFRLRKLPIAQAVRQE